MTITEVTARWSPAGSPQPLLFQTGSDGAVTARCSAALEVLICANAPRDDLQAIIRQFQGGGCRFSPLATPPAPASPSGVLDDGGNQSRKTTRRHTGGGQRDELRPWTWTWTWTLDLHHDHKTLDKKHPACKMRSVPSQREVRTQLPPTPPTPTPQSSQCARVYMHRTHTGLSLR